MALQMGANKKKVDYGVPEEGMAVARLVRVIDYGLQPQKPYQGQEKQPAFQMELTFELPNDRIEIDDESRPRWISCQLPISSSEKSRCYQWYNILDPKNQYKGDWSKLIGAACQIHITHNEYKQKTYANIKAVMPVMKGIEVGELENPSVVFDLSSPDMDVFNALPEWMRDKIASNLEYEGSKLERLMNDMPIPASAGTGDILDEQAEDDVREKSSKPAEVPLEEVDFDEDIPF